MKSIMMDNGFKLEISEGEEFFDFAKIIIKNRLYVKGFSLMYTLSSILEYYQSDIDFNEDEKKYALNKTKDSFIGLLKFGDEYVGMCAFFKFHPCTIQTFIREDFRQKGVGFNIIEKVLKIVKKNGHSKKVSFHHGTIQSLILFYKLWSSKLITLDNIVENGDKIKMRYIKSGLKGKKMDCFLQIEERKLFDLYIEENRKNRILIGEAA